MDENVERTPESTGQRTLAVLLTVTIFLGAVVTYWFTPTWITRYPSEARFFESPGFMPRVALVIMAICALIHVVRVLHGVSLDTGEDTDDGSSNRMIVSVGVALFVAYILLVPVLGYALATFGFVAAGSLIVGLGRARSLWLASVISIVLFGTFVVGLKVFFPTSVLTSFVA